MPEMPARELIPGTQLVKNAARHAAQDAAKMFLPPFLGVFLEVCVVPGQKAKYSAGINAVGMMNRTHGVTTHKIHADFYIQRLDHQQNHSFVKADRFNVRAAPFLGFAG